MQAVPIQVRATTQIPLRAGTGANRAATMAACGIHQATRLVRGRRSQSCELRAMSFATVALPRAAGGCVSLAGARGLDRRARHRTIRAEHAAVARLRAQHRATPGALIKEPARGGG